MAQTKAITGKKRTVYTTRQNYVLMDGSKALNINPWDMDSLKGWTNLSGGDIDDQNPEASYFKRVPWFYRGIKDRANNVSHMPFVIMDGKNEIDNSGEYTNALEWLPDPTTLFHKLEMSLAMTGRAYFKLELNSSDYVKGVKYLAPTTITEHNDDFGVVEYYKRMIKGKKFRLEVKEVVAIYDPDYTTESGPGQSSAAKAALTSAGVLYNADRFVSGFFEHGAIKASILSTETQDKGEAEKLQHWWDQVMDGVGHAWTKYVLRGKKVEITPVGEGLESLTNESLSTERRQDIATALGVPESRMWSAAANYATRVQDDKAYFEGTIIPDCELIAEAFDSQVFTEEHHLPTTQLQFKPETLDVFQTGALEQAQAVQAFVTAGFPLLMACDMAGVELTKAQRAELEAEDEPAPTPPQLLPYTGQDNPPALPAPADQAQGADDLIMSPDTQNALAMWQRKAIKRLKESGTGACDFVSDAIPGGINATIAGGLEAASTIEAIKHIFSDAMTWRGYP